MSPLGKVSGGIGELRFRTALFLKVSSGDLGDSCHVQSPQVMAGTASCDFELEDTMFVDCSWFPFIMAERSRRLVVGK